MLLGGAPSDMSGCEDRNHSHVKVAHIDGAPTAFMKILKAFRMLNGRPNIVGYNVFVESLHTSMVSSRCR